MGANINITLFALAGIIISLKIFQRPPNKSLYTIQKDQQHLVLCRFCTKAQILLSSQTIIATDTRIGNIKKNFINFLPKFVNILSLINAMQFF